MGYDTNSGPFWVGTTVFVVAAIIALCIAKWLNAIGKNPEFGLTFVMIIMTAFCTWMFWGMTWLMQWHPLIRPIQAAEE